MYSVLGGVELCSFSIYMFMFMCKLGDKCSFNCRMSVCMYIIAYHTHTHTHTRCAYVHFCNILFSLQKFGVMLSSTMRISTHFLGTGESYLFSVEDFGKLEIYHWSGINDYVFQGNSDSIVFGSDE